MLIRCANGFGAVALAGLLRRPGVRPRPAERARGDRAARASPPAFPGQGEERHLPVHGRRPVAGRHVRPQAAARPRARQADQDEDRSRRSSTTSATCSSRPGSSASTARAASPSATCSRTSPTCVDDLAIVRSMVSNFSEHTNANYFLHTGNGLQGRPSMGSWVTYGLGSECQDLPGLRRPQRRPDPARRPRLLQQRLPARRRTRARSSSRRQPGRRPPAAARPTDELQRSKLDLLRKLDRGVAGPHGRATTASSRPSPTTSWPSACRRPCPS